MPPHPPTIDKAVPAVERIIGYTFKDPSLLWEAMQASKSNQCDGRSIGNHTKIWDDGQMTKAFPSTRRLTKDGNERLALVGDACIRLVLADSWYLSMTNKQEGLQRWIEPLITVDFFADLGRQKGIDRWINRNEERYRTAWVATGKKTVASTVEAIMGAVLIDGGIPALKMVMQKLGIVPPVPALAPEGADGYNGGDEDAVRDLSG